MTNKWLIGALSLTFISIPAQTVADDLYRPGQWSSMSTDLKASQIGDILSVVIYQNAEASNMAQNARDRRSNFDANVDLDFVDVVERGDISFGGGFVGRGEVRRRERFVTRMSVTIDDILPNGDYLVSGGQHLLINGEETHVRVRGRVRPVDITGDNQILSTRIADAQIEYDGSGFVSKGTRPGLFHKIFGFLGLG